MTEERAQKQLSSTQKTGFVLLLIFGILAVSLGFLQMRNTIYSPFLLKQSGYSARAEVQLDEATRLQFLDTDRDGLNDYEELNFYETSPYLADTDSDGVPDKVEIDAGEDPLCPKGTVCAFTDQLTPTNTEKLVTSPLGNVGTVADIVNGSLTNTIDYETLLGDPAQLRALLLTTGQLTKEQIDSIDDATLIELGREIITEGGYTNTDTTPTQPEVVSSSTSTP